MQSKIKLGIVGCGRLGVAVAEAATVCPDIDLVGVFSRRDKSDIKTYSCGADILPFSEVENYAEAIDCMIVATGSNDTESITPTLASLFNVVDSFDCHDRLAQHVSRVDAAARAADKSALVGTGWDPGLLSLGRLYLGAFMPYAAVNTLWGRGVSLGHSAALRTVPGVKHAVQYTEPKEKAAAAARGGKQLTAGEAHRRVCYIVAEPGTEAQIIEAIFGQNGYFSGYDTEVRFISEAEFLASHTTAPHRGEVIAAGGMGIASPEHAEASLTLSCTSNAAFTANILIASARALMRLTAEGKRGAFTVFDIPPRLFAADASML